MTEERTVTRSPELLVGEAIRPIPPSVHRRRTSAWLLVALDALLIFTGFAIAYWMRYNVSWPAPFNSVVQEVLTVNNVPFDNFLWPYTTIMLVLSLALYGMKGLYGKPRSAGLFDYAGPIISGTTTSVALVVLWGVIQRPLYSRLVYAFAWVLIILLLLTARGALIAVRRWRWARGIARERVLVVGGTGLGREVMNGIVAQTFLGYSLVGYLEDEPQTAQTSQFSRIRHFQHLGRIDDLEHVLDPFAVDAVVLALPFWQHDRLPELVRICRTAGVNFRVAPDLFELSFDRVNVFTLGGIPLIGLKDVSLKGANLLLKRALDISLVVCGAPLFLPLAALIALAIKLDSPGPAIFKQRRVGKGGKLFTAFKFRTMVVDADERKVEMTALNEADGPIFKIRNDPRHTRIGRLLRRSSLDEIPQLWNVIRDEMSLVGPRPPTPDEVQTYTNWQRRRLEVNPGLTGLWQVLGRSDTSFDEMVRLDIYYAENWSPAMDLRILLETVPAVLSGRGAY